jgi:hypothetical protein
MAIAQHTLLDICKFSRITVFYRILVQPKILVVIIYKVARTLVTIKNIQTKNSTNGKNLGNSNIAFFNNHFSFLEDYYWSFQKRI